MSVGAVVQHVSEALRRAHALFGEAGDEPTGIGGLRDAAARMAAARRAATGLSGRLAARYGAVAADAAIALDGFAAADDRLAARLGDATDVNRHGRNASGHVLDGAATDTARISPLTGTPAGQRALVTALRDRVLQQDRVVAALRVRDARLAAELRAMLYQRGGRLGAGGAAFPAGGGGAPLGATIGGPAAAAATGWPRAGAPAAGRTRIAETADWSAPNGPAGAAVAAALGKRGHPYEWGAKGPTVFDCSGLTQWAWRQAGVHLGGDTYAQITDGIPVPPGQVRAGDLIFPTSSFGEGGQPGPGHVMLAISTTQVVHAPHTGDVVRVAPMPSRFVARRPIPITVV